MLYILIHCILVTALEGRYQYCVFSLLSEDLRQLVSWENRIRTRNINHFSILSSVKRQTDMNLGELWEMVREGRPGVLQSLGSQRVGHGT